MDMFGKKKFLHFFRKKKKLVVFIFNMFYRVLSNIIWTSSEFFQICNFGVSKYNFKVYPKKKQNTASNVGST